MGFSPLITHPCKENLFIMTLTKLKDTIVSFYLGTQKLHGMGRYLDHCIVQKEDIQSTILINSILLPKRP